MFHAAALSSFRDEPGESTSQETVSRFSAVQADFSLVEFKRRFYWHSGAATEDGWRERGKPLDYDALKQL